MRTKWHQYYRRVSGIVWVIDSTDRRRMYETGLELRTVLEDAKLAGVPLLICANKQDLVTAMRADEITIELELHGIRNRNWHIQRCSALNGTGVEIGMKWMTQNFLDRRTQEEEVQLNADVVAKQQAAKPKREETPPPKKKATRKASERKNAKKGEEEAAPEPEKKKRRPRRAKKAKKAATKPEPEDLFAKLSSEPHFEEEDDGFAPTRAESKDDDDGVVTLNLSDLGSTLEAEKPPKDVRERQVTGGDLTEARDPETRTTRRAGKRPRHPT